LVVHFDETGLLDPIPHYLTESAYRLQANWLRQYGSGDDKWKNPMPKLDRQRNPWSPAGLFTSESRSLNDLLSNSLDTKWPVKKLMQIFKKNSDRESERLAIQRRREALRIANQIDDTEPSLKIDTLLGEMTPDEKRVFRKERRRRRRLFKEEQMRANRRMELQRMRNRAAKQQTVT
jgi:hypothetical protein